MAAIVAFVLGCGTLAVFSATSRTSEPTSEGIAVQINPTDTFPLATIKPIQTVPVVVTQAVATNPLAPTILPTQQPTARPTDSPQPTNQPTATMIPATATPAPDAVVAIAQLNMREGPDTTYNLVSSYNQGTPLELLGKNSDASWLKVRAPDGNIGWMFAANLDLGLALGGIEVAAAPPRPTSVPQATNVPPPEASDIAGQWYLYNHITNKQAYIAFDVIDNKITRISTIYRNRATQAMDCGSSIEGISVPVINNNFSFSGEYHVNPDQNSNGNSKHIQYTVSVAFTSSDTAYATLNVIALTESPDCSYSFSTTFDNVSNDARR